MICINMPPKDFVDRNQVLYVSRRMNLHAKNVCGRGDRNWDPVAGGYQYWAPMEGPKPGPGLSLPKQAIIHPVVQVFFVTANTNAQLIKLAVNLQVLSCYKRYQYNLPNSVYLCYLLSKADSFYMPNDSGSSEQRISAATDLA